MIMIFMSSQNALYTLNEKKKIYELYTLKNVYINLPFFFAY